MTPQTSAEYVEGSCESFPLPQNAERGQDWRNMAGFRRALRQVMWVFEVTLWPHLLGARGVKGEDASWEAWTHAARSLNLSRGSVHPEGALGCDEMVLRRYTVLSCSHDVKQSCLQLLQSSRVVGTFICHCRKESQYFMKKVFYHRTLVNVSII